MNKKGFCWKRTVSVLMAMAMLITAAPQTGMSVYATGGGNADDLLSVDGITTQGAVGDENDGDVGGDETAKDPGNTDESENVGGDTGGTENPEVPGDPENPNLSGDAGQPDNGDEAGDSEDEAEPEESGDELTEDEESMSMNDIGADVMSADEPMAALETDDETPWYENEELFESIIGREGSSQEGDKRLIIQVAWAKENHVSIADIREYYQTNGDEKFNCVQLQNEVDDKYSSSEVTLDAVDFNTACDLLDTGSENYWIDYNFYFPKDEIGVGYTLSKPVEMSGDLKVSYSVALRENQGIIVNLSKTTGYPVADDGGIYINWNKNGDDIYKYLQNDDDAQTRVFAWNGSKPTGMVDLYENINYNNDNGNAYFGLPGGAFMPYDENDNRVLFKANQYYLITSLYVDENSAPMEGTTELTAGQRAGVDSSSVSSASWTVLSADKIKIAPQNSAKVQLSGLNPGDAYYWVSYRAGGKDYGELHMVRAAYVNAKGDHEYTYIGEISKDDDKSTRLRIDENEAFNNNTTVQEILDYYGLDENNEWNPAQRFNVVQLDMQEPESSISGNAMTVKIKGEVFRPACGLLAYESNNWRIDYNFNYVDGEGYYTGKHIGYTLNSPNGDAVADDGEFAVTCTMQPLENQGVVIRLNRVDFPVNENRNGGGVFLNWGRDGFDVNEYFDTSKKAHVVAWDGSKPTEVLNISTDNFYDGGFGLSVGDAFGPRYDEDDQVLFGANQDYLVTTLYADEKAISLGSERDLEVGLRAGGDASSTSDVEWTVLNTDLISIVPAAEAGGVATLKANEEDKTGEAYYWVNYQVEGKDYSELHSVIVAAVGTNGKELVYLGEERNESFDDDGEEIHFKRLVIDETEAKEKNNGASITDILDYRRERGDVFNCVQFEVIDSSPKTRTMNKDYINKARAIMGDVDEYHGCWMDYNFRSSDSDGRETRVEFTMTTLTGDAKKNVPASFTLTELANQGLKVKFTSTADFPAERVEMRYNVPAMYDKSIPIEDGQLRLFTHSSGTPTAMVSIAQEQGWGYYNTNGDGEDPWSNFYFNNIKPLGNKEYLAASIYEDVQYDESGMIGTKPVVGVATQMKAGTRAGGEEDTVLTSVTWKTFDTDKATIDKNGMLTAWTPEGEIYYYVKYKVGKDTYLEIHKTQATNEVTKIAFDRDEFDMDYYASEENEDNRQHKWLELRYYPHLDADRSSDRLEWKITSGKDTVVSFANKEVPDNEIVAVGPGTATVQVSYLAGDYQKDEGGNYVYDENGNWIFEPSGEVIWTAECTINVVKKLEWWDVYEKLDSVDFYAVMDVDATLADIADLLPESDDGTYEWAVPTTKLTTFKGMSGNQFAVKYTAKDGQIFNTHVWVDFVTLKGIHMMYAVGDGDDVSTWQEWQEVPVSVTKGGKLKLVYYYDLDNAWYPEGPRPENPDDQNWYDRALARYKGVMEKLEDKAQYEVEWTVVDKQNPPEDGDYYVYDTDLLTASKKVKKSFTVSVVQYNGNKKKVICKDTRSVTVTMKDLADLDQIGAVTIKYDENDNNKPWLVVEVNDPGLLENYSLTPASEDTAILKLSTKAADKIMNNSPEVTDKGVGEPDEMSEGGKQYIKIACTTLKPGHAWIKLTSNDEMGTFRRYPIYTPDYAPKAVSPTTVTINKILDNKTAEVTVRTDAQYPLKDKDGSVIGSDEAKELDFKVNKAGSEINVRAEEIPSGEEQYKLYKITLGLDSVENSKNGKYTVTLNLKADNDESDGTYTLPLTVNISDAKPKVTFKQSKKVNLFYNDREADGVLTVTVANGAEITDLQLVDYEDKKGVTECNYKLDQQDGVYYITLKEGKDPAKNKKGLLKYKLAGYDYEFPAVTFTVSTENKKPTLVMSATSDTLYTKVSYNYSWLSIRDKATGWNISLDPDKDKVSVTDAKKNVYPMGYERDEDAPPEDGEVYRYTGAAIETANNSFWLNMYTWGGISTDLTGDGPYKAKTDKFTVSIQKSNWTAPVSVSYSIVVNNSDPKLVLSSSTVTLNRNSGVYQAQQALVTLSLKGYHKELDAPSEWGSGDWVRFAGVDDKSKKILSGTNLDGGEGSLSLDYWNHYSEERYTTYSDVAVRLKNDKIPTGTYKIKVSVGREWENEPYASATLTVKIVDSDVSKNIKVTAKGTIDLMDREGTSVTYTPKLTNLSGKITDAWLEGRDASRFDCGGEDEENGYQNWWDGSKLTVKAISYVNYSTKETYEVIPVFWVEVENYGGYRIEGKPVTIKVKQGKPKLTAAAAQNNTNVIYRNLDNEVEIKLSSIYNKKDVEIANVWLASYTDDFQLIEHHQDRDGNPICYNPDTQTIRLKLRDRYAANSVVKSGKTWKVKIQVWYSNQAPNEKAGEVTYSVVVR